MPLISHSSFPSPQRAGISISHKGSVKRAVRSKELVSLGGESSRSLKPRLTPAAARSLWPGLLSCGSALRALTITAVSEFSILCNLQFSWVCGGDPITCLHAVPLFQLSKGTH